MEIKIKDNSWHFRLYCFIKRPLKNLNKIFPISEEDTFESYIIFKQDNLYRKLDKKWNFTKFNFRFIKDIKVLLKTLLSRFFIYQFWGSNIIFFILLVFVKSAGINQISNIIFLSLFAGIFPIMFLFLILWIPFILFKLFLNMFSMPNHKISLAVEKPKYLFSYFCSFILLPIAFIIRVIAEVVARIMFSGIYYAIIGFFLFIENIWLLFNFVILLVFGLVLPAGKILLILANPFKRTGKAIFNFLTIQIK